MSPLSDGSFLLNKARLAGIEPATYCLEGSTLTSACPSKIIITYVGDNN